MRVALTWTPVAREPSGALDLQADYWAVRPLLAAPRCGGALAPGQRALRVLDLEVWVVQAGPEASSVQVAPAIQPAAWQVAVASQVDCPAAVPAQAQASDRVRVLAPAAVWAAA